MELKGKKKIRLEYTDESSDKFWELTPVHGVGIEAMDYIATYGKIGAKGQSHKYSFLEAQKKLREKIAKGYKVVDLEVVELGFSKEEDEKFEDELKGILGEDEEEDPVLFDFEEEVEPEFDFMEELRKI
jgi:predicted DNA-binding WGR domain protein